MRRPLEILVPAAVFAVGAVVFLVVGVVRDAVQVPVVLAVLAALAVAGVWVRLGWGRVSAVAVAALIALVHTLIALDAVHWGLAVLSGVLAAAHAYAAVLLLTKPAREYQEGVSGE